LFFLVIVAVVSLWFAGAIYFDVFSSRSWAITAKMEKRFCNIAPGAPPTRKRPSTIQTLLRSFLVQNYNLNSYGVGPADVVIAPDVPGFELTEFMRAKELAAIGEAAAMEQVPKICQLLQRLDPQLFRTREIA
jgi:hypothetical protein